jgi:acyl-CoA synthetase (AMP-forming)/AMP-acid ligase II
VLKAHPDVFDAVVVGVPDQRFGERVAAVVAHRTDRSVDIEGLEAHCRVHLADFKVPRRVVVVEAVVRRPSGKVDLEWAAATVLAGHPPR